MYVIFVEIEDPKTEQRDYMSAVKNQNGSIRQFTRLVDAEKFVLECAEKDRGFMHITSVEYVKQLLERDKEKD